MSASPIRDVLLPGSDRVALVQAIVVAALTLTVTYLVRRERSLVLLAVGSGIFLLGLMALRTLH